MKYFITKDNKVRAFEEDGSQDELITKDMTPIDPNELEQVLSGLTPPSLRFADKQAEISGALQKAMRVITQSYTPEEIASWPVQLPEAEAYLLDSKADTPLLDAILSARPSVSKADLAARIVNNAANYRAVAGVLIGKKQAMEDALFALDPETVTQADIDAILVDFS